ncbi:MAG: GerMN domain-containing protein [Thermodesulfobacteriota bacterium]|nr:GerMN domain-containing protein [Thermodesulfobacteriota bacterium]
MQKSKKNKGKTRKSTPKLGIIFIFLIATITFLASSFFYYKFHLHIPTKQSSRVSANLYFADRNGKNLVIEKREVEASSTLINQAKYVILELIKGPDNNLKKTIPHGTKLRDLSLNAKGIAIVDFSPELISKHPGGSYGELFTIYSIVNTLTLNFKEIKKVQIVVEGKNVGTIAGHIYVASPFSANTTIVGK